MYVNSTYIKFSHPQSPDFEWLEKSGAGNTSLIVGKIMVKLRNAARKGNSRRELYDIDKIKQHEIQKKFKLESRIRFRPLENLYNLEASTVDQMEEEWSGIQTILKETSKNYLGFRNQKRKQWQSNNTWKSIEE